MLDEVEWRQLWEEQTSDDKRKRLRQAVFRGKTMPTPDEAAIAAELAIREARSLRFGAVFAFLVGAAMLVALLAVRPEAPAGIYWLWIGIALVWLAINPSVRFFRLMHVLQAYRGNRTLSERGS